MNCVETFIIGGEMLAICSLIASRVEGLGGTYIVFVVVCDEGGSSFVNENWVVQLFVLYLCLSLQKSEFMKSC